MPDLLERVSAANPVSLELDAEDRRAAERLCERVVSTPAGTARSRRAPRRRLTLAAAAGVLGLALAVLVLAGRGPSVAERAYAAVSADQGVFHVVMRMSADVPPELDGMPVPAGTRETEAWFDVEGASWHSVQYEIRDGRRVMVSEAASSPEGNAIRESAGEPPRVSEPIGPQDVAPFDPMAEFKAAYRAGRVREEGETTVDGRRAHRLVVDHPAPAVRDPGFDVRSSRSVSLIDAETLHPIETVNESVVERNGRRGTLRTVTRFTTYEILGRTPENLALLEMQP